MSGMRGFRVLLALAVGLFFGFALSINEKSMVMHQVASELGRLASHGYLVRVDLSEDGCAHAQSVTNEFVVFCLGGNQLGLVRGKQWPSQLSRDDEQALLDLWVNRYIQQGQHERAAYGAARVATLVARDKLGVNINEPLAPMPPPRAAVLRAQHPSQSGVLGVALTFFVFVLCGFFCRGRYSGR